MPLWTCDWDHCNQPAVRRAGDCDLCSRHFCRMHLKDSQHDCPDPVASWKDFSNRYAANEARQLEELCRKLNSLELRARASLLRGGQSCTIDLSPKHLSMRMGGQHCHALVRFEDGVEWIARFRLRKVSTPPPQVCDYIHRSEAATMIYLQDHTKIPSPQIFDWACESDPGNLIGVSYFLIAKIEGEPLSWQGATLSQKEKVMQQLVDISFEFEKHPFTAIGSITPTENNETICDVQGFAHHSTFRTSEGGPLGPYTSWKKAARAIIEYYLKMIANGEVADSHIIDTYLMHRFRLEILDSIWKTAPSDGTFFLKHPDDKGDHIFVNESFKIVALIDWEWTQTVSKEDAFCSPCMMWPVNEFYDGSNELSEDEKRYAQLMVGKGRSDLAAYVTEGRRIQRFLFALGPSASHTDWDSSIALFAGLRRAFDPDDSKSWDAWKSDALRRYKDDELLERLLQNVKQHA